MVLRARLKRLERWINKPRPKVGCIGFPPDEPPSLELRGEIEAARSVLFPLHGQRFTRLAPILWRVIDLAAHLSEAGWKRHSAQYIKEMKASFPPDRFPARRVEEADVPSVSC